MFFTTMAVRPKTKAILVMLEPITLPTTISDCPANTEAIEVANSGKEVPKATMVTPIIKGEIPIERPMDSAESTNQLDALSRVASAAIKIPI
jgi:hypothetical protein